MERRDSSRAVENLRFRFQMNNRLRLECLAAVSKVFREFGEPLSDELLSSIIFALPQELVAGNGHGSVATQLTAAGTPPQKPKDTPGTPPEKPEKPEKPDKEKPGTPPQEPEMPGTPPEEPMMPGVPPQSPETAAAHI